MKKIILSAVIACAAFANANAAGGSASNNNQMQVVVPVVLSVTAVPSYQAVYLTDADLNNGTVPLTPMVYNIRSNASYTTTTDFTLTEAWTYTPGPGDQATSIAAFRAAMQFSTDNSSFYDLDAIDAVLPFTSPLQPATSWAGTGYTLYAKLANLSMNIAPGVYTTTITVTATQP